MPSPRRRPTPALGFLLASWAALLVIGRTKMFRDPGTFWHVLTGERILTSGFPRTDWLTFTRFGEPWVAHQWLADCLMAILHRAGGLDALLVATSGTLALLFTSLLQRLTSAGVALRWSLMFVVLAVTTSAGQFHVRPLVLSIAFFAGTCATLHDYEVGRISLRRLTLLVPVFVVWSNTHGAVIGGLASVGFCTLGWLGCWALRLPSPVMTARQGGALLLVLLACGATPLVNPYGLDLPRTWARIVQSPVLPQVIVEHASVMRTGSWYVLALGLVYAGLFASAPTLWRSPAAWLPVIWFALTVQRVRQAPLLACAVCVALPRALAVSRAAAWLALRGVRIMQEATSPPAPTLSTPRSAACALPLSLLLVTAVHVHRGSGEPFLVTLDRARWPIELVPTLNAIGASVEPGAPILNDTYLGAFIEYFAPRFRVFSDDRCELFPDEFLRDLAAGDIATFARWDESARPRVALARPGSPLLRYLRSAPHWAHARSSTGAELYVRHAGAANGESEEQP